MNGRILELAEQAGASVSTIGGIFINKTNLDIEKFAELIIQECAGKVDNILREKKDGGGTMGDEIREHFGVK